MICKNGVVRCIMFSLLCFNSLSIAFDKKEPMNAQIAIIPAAGFGTRFLPFTKTVPKELVPINGRPSIEYIIEECVQNGISTIYIIANKDKRALYDYFNNDNPLDHFLKLKNKTDLLKTHYELLSQIKVVFIEQHEQKGLGHAILCAQPMVNGGTCAVLLPDEIFASTDALSAMQQLAQQHSATVVAVQTVAQEKVSSYGIVKPGLQISPDAFWVTDIVEKPSIETAPSQLAVCGRYVLQPAVFDALTKITPGAGGEYQLTDAIAYALHNNHPVIAYEYRGDRFDVGNPQGFLKANIFFTK
jgi:UTP--glucose-1-phosphate uridylyltransferase